MNTHTGTHIDAPFHMLPQGKKLEEYPLETFFGKAKAVEVMILPLRLTDADGAPCRVVARL